MAKQRFRDIKQGKIKTDHFEKSKSTKALHATKSQRFKAFITDSFMLAMPIMYIVFYLIFDGRGGFAANKLLGWIYILQPLIIVQFLFLSFSIGQTPGMKAYNIVLIDLKTKEKPATGIILYRQMLTILSLFAFGWISIFFRKDSRPLHDILSSTTLMQLNNTQQN